ncbi:MAG: response regulator [Phycisphaerales bacterium]
MKASCVLMAVGNQRMLRSLKMLLEPHVEISAMTDNVLSLIDAVEALGPDLAIVHTPIPDRDHMNMMRHLKSRFPELKMIVVSDHTDSVEVCDVLNEGVQGYVFQHNTKTELLPAVEEVLRGCTYVSAIEGQEGEQLANPQN